jgi:hypothetical protein
VKGTHDLRRFYKDSQKANDQSTNETGKEDLLAMYLDDRSVLNQVMKASTVKKIKNDIILKFKQRVFSKADIIEKRIREEKAELDKHQKNNERLMVDASGEREQEGRNIQAKINELNKNIQILENRAQRFEATAMENYRKLQEVLETDPRLQIVPDGDGPGYGRN